MAEDWRKDTAIDKLHVVRYLLALADDRGRTHGEKHHIHQVIGMVTIEILNDLGSGDLGLERNVDKSGISDIPF